jgi:FkbM family methyltransferase
MKRVPPRLAVGMKVLASTLPNEWPRIMVFALITLLRDMPVVGRVVPAELWLKLRGAWFLVGTAQSEMGGFVECCVLRKYEPDARFSPQPGSTVADIGANIGFFAIMHARRHVRVLAVEPNPEAYRRLEAAVQRNRLKDQVMLFNCALARGPGIADFVFEDRSTTTGRLATGQSVSVRRTVRVVTETLDRIVQTAAAKTIRLLKVDVEGAECDVLDGGRRVLGMCNNVVLEYHGPAQLSCVRSRLGGHGFEEVFLSKTHVAFGRS